MDPPPHKKAISAKLCLNSYANSNAIGGKQCVEKYAEIAEEQLFLLRDYHQYN